MKKPLEAGLKKLRERALRARLALGVSSAALVLTLAPVSGAQPSEAALGSPEPASAVALNEAGARYFEEGRYRLAVERFIHAYALEKDPNLLFNIASCYERLGDSRAAIEKYREFLAAPDAAAEGRAPADAAIARLEAQAAAVARARSPLEKPARVAERRVAEHTPEGGAGIAGSLRWATLGSGVALASLGLAVYWMGSRDHGKVTEARGHADQDAVSSLSRAEARRLVDSGSSKKALGVTGLALGGTLMAASGAWMLWQAYAGAADPSAASVAAAPRSGGGTLTISGSF